MTKTEIIKETYKYYTADPNGKRALINYRCVYYESSDIENGKKCAVGRCLNLKDDSVKKKI